MKKFFTPLIILTLVSCNNLRSHKDEVVQFSDSISNSGNLIDETKTCYVPFQLSDTFTILRFKSVVDPKSSSADTIICGNWTLTALDIDIIIRHSEIISGPEWHYLFSHEPCSVMGQLGQNGNAFDFKINAGSWLTITCGDSTIRLGNFNKDDEYLFLSAPILSEVEQ